MSRVVRRVHVVPVLDTREHDLSPGCWCEPRVEDRDPETGEPYQHAMVVHASEDCRESVERLLGEPVEEGKGWASVETTEVVE